MDYCDHKWKIVSVTEKPAYAVWVGPVQKVKAVLIRCEKCGDIKETVVSEGHDIVPEK